MRVCLAGGPRLFLLNCPGWSFPTLSALLWMRDAFLRRVLGHLAAQGAAVCSFPQDFSAAFTRGAGRAEHPQPVGSKPGAKGRVRPGLLPLGEVLKVRWCGQCEI